MPAAKLKRGDGTLDYRVLDQRAMELLLSAHGYTLEQAYQQARDEQARPVRAPQFSLDLPPDPEHD